MSAIEKFVENIQSKRLEKIINSLLKEYLKCKDSDLKRATDLKQEIIEYLKICDLLHQGHNVNGFDKLDIPSDSFYEYAKNSVGYVPKVDFSDVLFPMGSVTKPKNNDISFKGLIYKSNPSDSFIPKSVVIMPKFDGVSIGLLLKRNRSSFNDLEFVVDAAATRQKQIVSIEMRTLIKRIYFSATFMKFVKESKNSVFNSFDNGLGIQDIESLKLRGEFIMKYKDYRPPAPTISGWLKQGQKAILEEIDSVRLIAYEVADIVLTNGKHVSLTQIQSLILLNNIFIETPVETLTLGSPFIEISKPEAINSFQEDPYPTYEKFEQFEMPLDGLVYSDSEWIYPLDSERFNKVDYGKNAFKPSQTFYTVITGIEHSMSPSGEVTCSVQYLPIMHDGKKYTQQKTPHHKIVDNGYAVGSIVRVVLSNGISLQLGAICHDHKYLIDELVKLEVLESDHNPRLSENRPQNFEFLGLNSVDVVNWLLTKPILGAPLRPAKNCAYCQTPLVIGKRMLCPNPDCSKKTLKQYSELISRIRKIKTVGPLTTWNKAHTELGVKSSLTAPRLEELSNQFGGSLSLEALIQEIPNFFEVFKELTTIKKAWVLQLGGEKTLETKYNEAELREMILNSFLLKGTEFAKSVFE